MVAIIASIVILCVWSRSVDAYRISCPQQFVCKCKSVKIYPRQAVIENRIDCKERGLQDVPDFSATHGLPISKILLAHNQITYIANGTFKDIRLINANSLSPIPNLDLSYNPLGHLEGSGLDGLLADRLSLMLNNCSLTLWPLLPSSVAAVITEFYLKDNMLLSIPNGGMAYYSQLKLLDLSGNKHMSLAIGSLDGLEDVLEILYLEEMELSSMPTGVLQPLRALRFLYLMGNHITHIPDFAFYGFKSTELTVDLSENSVVQVGKDALRHHPNIAPGTERTNFTIKKLSLDDNLLGDLDFLVDPCSLLVGNQSTVAVRNNPIKCDCFLYNLTRLRVVEVHGSCASPKRYIGASLDGFIMNLLDQTTDPVAGQPPGFSPLALKFGVSTAAGAFPRRRKRLGSFLEEAQEQCNGGTDELLHQQYICECRKWKPYYPKAILDLAEQQVVAQAQQCSNSVVTFRPDSAACPSISFGSLYKCLITAIPITYITYLHRYILNT